jgi:predicted  nucleic acid-binding Zn-ribbon protein
MLNDSTLTRLERDLRDLHDRERGLTDEIRQAQTDHQQKLRELESDLDRELARIDHLRTRIKNDIHYKQSEIERRRDQLLHEQAK